MIKVRPLTTRSFPLRFASLSLIGCSGLGVDYGVISSKEHQPERTYSSVQSMVVTGTNGSSSSTSIVMVPTTEVDDEDWVLSVYGERESGKPSIDTWYVSQETFEAYKNGDHISFDPNTMSRFDRD